MVKTSAKARHNDILVLWPYAPREEIERFFHAYRERSLVANGGSELSFCGITLKELNYRSPNQYDELLNAAEAWMSAKFYKELEEAVPRARYETHGTRI